MSSHSTTELDFHVFDTTLRDGAQREGVSYSVADKLAVARLMDEIGVGFIEGGWPGALPKDTEFFARARTELKLRHAQLVAFGATRKAGVRVEDDLQVRALLDAETPVVCLVAKSDVRHVREALRTTLEENLAMVADTVAFFVAHGRRVFLDCEHFFDGYAHDRDYGVQVLEAAFGAGAEVGVMCDTNGGMLPMGVGRVVADVRARTNGKLGIHCQDDTGCAVANSLAAVEAGVTHVQGTANGYGERAGNADTFSLVGNLVTKMGLQVVPPECLPELQRVSHAIAELANIAPDDHQPFVGTSAFAHKAGLHASAIKVSPELYNHLDPAVVGNDMRILVTEMAGRASVELKGRELGVDLAGQGDAIGRVVDRVKVLEADGWSFEAADASFELMLRSELPDAPSPLFELESYKTSVEHWGNGVVVSEATVKVHLRQEDGTAERIISTAEGNGPVNALDNALRQALVNRYPDLADVGLADYKVRILGWKAGTSATTRVLITTTDGVREWTTVGVHDNIVEASWHALVDALTYAQLVDSLSLVAPSGPGVVRAGVTQRLRSGRGRLLAAALPGGQPGVQQAELVALGVGEDVPVLLAGLADVGRDGPEIEQALQLGVLVAVGRVDVDVQSQLARGGVGHRPEDQRRRGAAEPRLGADLDGAVLAGELPVVEDLAPEPGERLGVPAVDDEFAEAAGHGRTIGRKPPD